MPDIRAMNGNHTSQCGVLCSGSIVFDVVVRPFDDADWGTTTLVDSLDSSIGGNGANTSIALARIGMPVRLLGTVGDDDRGRFAFDSLHEAGVDTAWICRNSRPTAATVVIVNSDGNRKFLHRMGASECAFSEPIDFIPAITAGMSHYHLASLFILPRMREHASETLRRARSAGLSTSADTNWDPQGRWIKDLGPCLPYLDILFMNEDEARMVTGEDVPENAAEAVLRRGLKTAVIKLGRHGCAIYNEQQQVLCPSFDVEAVDTTGAGDCFVAGFLAALQRGKSLAEAGRFANAVAAMSVQSVGAVTGVPRSAEIHAWIANARLR